MPLNDYEDSYEPDLSREVSLSEAEREYIRYCRHYSINADDVNLETFRSVAWDTFRRLVSRAENADELNELAQLAQHGTTLLFDLYYSDEYSVPPRGVEERITAYSYESLYHVENGDGELVWVDDSLEERDGVIDGSNPMGDVYLINDSHYILTEEELPRLRQTEPKCYIRFPNGDTSALAWYNRSITHIDGPRFGDFNTDIQNIVEGFVTSSADAAGHIELEYTGINTNGMENYLTDLFMIEEVQCESPVFFVKWSRYNTKIYVKQDDLIGLSFLKEAIGENFDYTYIDG